MNFKDDLRLDRYEILGFFAGLLIVGALYGLMLLFAGQ